MGLMLIDAGGGRCGFTFFYDYKIFTVLPEFFWISNLDPLYFIVRPVHNFIAARSMIGNYFGISAEHRNRSIIIDIDFVKIVPVKIFLQRFGASQTYDAAFFAEYIIIF